jgi:hypothetical protein
VITYGFPAALFARQILFLTAFNESLDEVFALKTLDLHGTHRLHLADRQDVFLNKEGGVSTQTYFAVPDCG